jgi:hypothetical protein
MVCAIFMMFLNVYYQEREIGIIKAAASVEKTV